MTPQTLTLDSHVEGDTFTGIPGIQVLIDGVPPSSPLARVVMAFQRIDRVVSDPFEITSDGPTPGIQISSAANWQFSVLVQDIPQLTEGRWRWAIKTITADNNATATDTTATFLRGDIVVTPRV